MPHHFFLLHGNQSILKFAILSPSHKSIASRKEVKPQVGEYGPSGPGEELAGPKPSSSHTPTVE